MIAPMMKDAQVGALWEHMKAPVVGSVVNILN